jgi:hypothetical protein
MGTAASFGSLSGGGGGRTVVDGREGRATGGAATSSAGIREARGGGSIDACDGWNATEGIRGRDGWDGCLARGESISGRLTRLGGGVGSPIFRSTMRRLGRSVPGGWWES